MKDLKFYLHKAQKGGWALGQFNFSTLEFLRGILAAAYKLKSPVIIGTTEGGVKYWGLEEIVASVTIAKKQYKVPAFLHLDHGHDLKLIKQTIDAGYESVLFDGSTLSYQDNVKYTKEVVRYAHKKGVLVEGELGHIEGQSILHLKKARLARSNLTQPEEAAKFVKATGVDSLAVAIGNIHGVYKKMPRLDFNRLKEINQKVPAFLVMHGTSGTAEKDVKQAVKLGIDKTIFSTELRLAWTKALASSLRTIDIKPYHILPKAQEAVTKTVESKIILLSSKNKI